MSALAGVIRWGGLPVPYVAAWSSEDTPRVERDPVIGNLPAIVRNGRRGDGKPIFGKMDERRVRRVVVERLCQVCTKPLRGDGFVIDVPYARTATGAQLIHEPPTCRDCFRASLAHCPGIARLRENRRVLIARVRDYDAVSVLIGPHDDGTLAINAALAAWRGPVPVIGYCRAAIGEHAILSADDLAALSPSSSSGETT